MTDILLNAYADSRGRNIRITGEQLQLRALETDVAGGVDAIGQIQPDRTDRCPVANPEPGGMNHVVEVLRIFLRGAE